MNQRSRQRVAALLPALLPALLLGIVAFTLVLVISEPPGPGLDPDALQYMGAAESFAGHLTYRVPTATWASADSTMALAHFPPGLSTALALPVRLGMTPPQGARLLNAVAAGITVTVLVLLVSGATAPLAGILLAVALFATSIMHEMHVSVLSEPIFLACLALTIAAMTRAPDRPLRAGIPAALAALTRYAGVAVVAAVVLWQLLQRAHPATRLRRAALAAAPALLLQGAWVLRTRHAAGTTTAIRRIALYTKDFGATLRGGGVTLSNWLVPDPDAWNAPLAHHGALALAAGAVLLTLMAGGARRAWRARQPAGGEGTAPSTDAWRLLAASTLILPCYLGIVFVSRLLADPAIPLDTRILAPVLLLVMTMAAATIALWWREPRCTLARIAVCGALLGWFAASASVTKNVAAYVLTNGSDFANDQWRRSDLVAWARRDGATHPLYSNWPAAVYFHLHRPARFVPKRDDPRGLAAFADTLRVRDGRVLAFGVSDREYATEPMLLRLRGLHVVVAAPDGVVLGPTARPGTGKGER